MKKTIAVLLSVLLFISSLSFSASAETWDGEASSGFAKGSGSESDPYLISSAAEFDYLFRQLDLGSDDFSGKYFELTNDIVFNDEAFEFQPDTGLVKVTDGENVIYFGTGIPGDKSGENNTFDETASNNRYIYTSDTSVEGVHYYEHYETYGGKLNFLHSAMSTTGFKAFKGHLNGKGYSVKGVLASGDASTNCTKYAGLFRLASDATIKYLDVEDSFVFGSGSGGIVGNAENCTFNGCSFDGIILGGGGIASEAKNSNFENCQNKGIIIGGYSGGIVGNNSADSAEYHITNCEHTGRVLNNSSNGICGGIAGGNSVARIYACKNKGSVSNNNADAITNLFGTGGVVGSASDCEVVQCMNYGTVSGLKYVGGIVGNADEVNVSDSSNRNIVKGESTVGGIIGYLGVGTTAEIKIENNYNDNAVVGNTAGGIIGWAISHNSLNIIHNLNEGYISGGSTVGGIMGSLTSAKGCVTFSYCVNANEIMADGNNIGGIIGAASAVRGSVIIEKSFNSAVIEGVNQVGGLVGKYTLDEFDGTILIENSYNSGDIYGVLNIGGFVGNVSRNLGLGTPLDIKTAYTIGIVMVRGDDVENEAVGILLGSSNCQINTEDCYYSKNITEWENSKYGSSTKVSDGATALPLADMNKQESFVGFDFASVWEINDEEYYKYPTIIDLVHTNHSHYTYIKCDEEYHWIECNSCGYATAKEAHYGEWEEWVDGERFKICEECKLTIGHEKQKFILGDINDDKEINQYDYILAKRIHFNTYTPNDEQKVRGDVNKDGSNNQYDYILIKRHHFKNYTITG